MAKRKRQAAAVSEPAPAAVPAKKPKSKAAPEASKPTLTSTKLSKASKPTKDTKTEEGRGAETTETIQIIAGSYDRVLHGLTATIKPKGEVDFADTFLFAAHSSSIRCVAVSPISAPIPGQTQKVLLASGSTDERIQVYNLSAHPPSRKSQDVMASVAPRPILENSKNRELGTLLHHESTVTALRFPTRSKLLSSSDDSTIAVTRTRDWSMLSNIKVPKAKAQGRPSGDTAPFGGTPAGVNDFAIHPSMKLMISVSKGERCMRLWNLVTGKKAGVLSFSRDMLQEIGESRHSTGEARRVVWGTADGADEYAVGFDRNIVVFGMDSVPKCRVLPTTKVKIHQFSYITLDEEDGLALLAVGTEDGRIAFFSTRSEDLSTPESADQTTADKESKKTEDASLAVAKLIGYVGGSKDGVVSSRIKDFTVVASASSTLYYVVGASSDGVVRLWSVRAEELRAAGTEPATEVPIGKLRGTYETHNRITCMAAYLMVERPEGAEDSEDEVDDEEDRDGESDSESE